MAELVFDGVSVRLGTRLALKGASFRLRAGQLVALVGPNGAGKTSLLRAGLGLLPCTEGSVRLNGGDPRMLRPDARARLVAYLPQSRPLSWPLRVRDVVALGRFSYGGALGRLAAADAAAVERAMEASGLAGVADRRTDELSGGELARVHVARAMAAEAPILLADEPAAALDLLHAHCVMQMLRRFANGGGAALVSIHDLSLAGRFADWVVLLRDGAVLAQGTTRDVLTPHQISQAFGVRAEIGPHHSVVVTGPA